jgi:putative ABC transport system permease protein
VNAFDLIGRAVRNTFRSKARTALTVIAIFIGAFTLTITSGIGTGINRYIDTTVAAIGADDVMTVTKPAADADSSARPGDSADGPAEYDPDAISSGGFGPDGGATVQTMTGEDLETLAGLDGVLASRPVLNLAVQFIEVDGGTRYEISVAGAGGVRPDLLAGAQVDDTTSDPELILPASYLEVLGFNEADAAIGESVTLGLTDATGELHLVDVAVTGVSQPSIGPAAGAVSNDALTTALYDLQSAGLTDEESARYASAMVTFDPDSSADEVTALKDELLAAGYSGTTVADQLGTFTAVIDAIVLVLNAFAVIALLAAGFGIVNTLLMSVQERTREIGLMKAMGMGSGRVFGLFSLEAVFIGFLGSAIGTGTGILAGTAASQVLSGALFADLPGLTLIAFDVTSIATIIIAVMGIAFLAGTLPAVRAARADPIESLRYE